METAKKIGLAAAFGLLAFAMLGAGATKLMADPMHVTNFVDVWGYGTGMMYFTGLVEVTAALLIVVPASRFYGALLAGAAMVGAVATHLLFAEFGGLVAPIVLGSLAGITAFTHVPVSLVGSQNTPAAAA